MIKYILPNFYSDYSCNMVIKDKFFTTRNLAGIQGTFPFSIFNGSYNNIQNDSLAVYEDFIDSIDSYGILANMTLLDFGNTQLIPTDYKDSYGKVILEEFSHRKNFYFEVSVESFIEYLIEEYPMIQLILHQNYTSQHSSAEIQELINKYPKHIKGIIISSMNECKSVTGVIKFYLVSLSNCHHCNQFQNCIKFDQEATLEYSVASQFANCSNRKNIYPDDIVNKIQYAQTISDYILFDTIIHTKAIEEFAIIDLVLKNAEKKEGEEV